MRNVKYPKYNLKNRQLSYHRGIALHLKSVEILSAAAQLYGKSHLTRRIALSCGINRDVNKTLAYETETKTFLQFHETETKPRHLIFATRRDRDQDLSLVDELATGTKLGQDEIRLV